MHLEYATVFLFLLIGLAFVVVNVAVLGWIVRPRFRKDQLSEAKMMTYECGEPPIGRAWVRFDMRFYTVALIFLIFELEVAFLFPWAAVYRHLVRRFHGEAAATFVLVEVALFVGVLAVGLVYAWKKGDLEWVKSLDSAPPASADPKEIRP